MIPIEIFVYKKTKILIKWIVIWIVLITLDGKFVLSQCFKKFKKINQFKPKMIINIKSHIIVHMTKDVNSMFEISCSD